MSVARVLLCDSVDDVLLMLSMELGFHDDIEVVGAAHDGRSAVEIAERTRPDVVVLGLDLPVLGGLDALRRITALRPEARVVVLVGPDSERLVPQAMRLGAQRHVARDAAPHRIVAAIRAALSGVPPSQSAPGSRRAVVGGEAALAPQVRDALGPDGLVVDIAADEDSLMTTVEATAPDLVILDTSGELDAPEVTRRLRSEATTRDIPIVALVDRSLAPAALARATAGANDYLVKPVDPEELRLRASSALRRPYELSAMNPLTYLPGNASIEIELRRRAAAGEPFALLYVDLDNFKAYNDHYGFLRGDEVIKLEATCTVDAVRKHARAGFVGHVGGDDIVAIVEADAAEPIARDIVASWDRLVLPLYEPEEVARGYLEVPDRLGEVRRYPLSTVSIGIATNLHRAVASHWEASEIAAEMKRFAKSQEGSTYAFDRRGGEERRRQEAEPPPDDERRRRIIRLDG